MKTLFTTITVALMALTSFAQVRYVENEILLQIDPAENAEQNPNPEDILVTDLG